MALQWKDEFTDQLCDCIVAISDRDEAYRFLEDVATFSEIRAFAQRLQVANLLLKGMPLGLTVMLRSCPSVMFQWMTAGVLSPLFFLLKSGSVTTDLRR